MQHTRRYVSIRSVADEAETPNLLYGQAVDHYVDQGHCLVHTIRCLGYRQAQGLAWRQGRCITLAWLLDACLTVLARLD